MSTTMATTTTTTTKTDSNRVMDDNDDSSSRETADEAFLLQLLCTEIVKDGGACLVTSLKDYIKELSISKKRMNQLLISTIGKPKLLTFLENYPTIFHVDRNVTPHWVVLLQHQEEYVVNVKKEESKKENKENKKNQQQQQQQQQQDLLQSKVYNKALYILRKRQSKFDRRRQQQRVCNSADTYHETIKDASQGDGGDGAENGVDEEEEETKVNTFWLLQQCKWEVHSYLRSSSSVQDDDTEGVDVDDGSGGWLSYYQRLYSTTITTTSNSPEQQQVQQQKLQVQPVGTMGWEKLILKKFESILSSSVSPPPTSTTVIQQDHSWGRVLVKDGKAWLESISSSPTPPMPPQTLRLDDANNGMSEDNGSCYDREIQDQNEEGDEGRDVEYLKKLDDILTKLVVHVDGANQVRLEVLLHRHPTLKYILGGRDLWSIYQKEQQRHSQQQNGDKDMEKETPAKTTVVFFQHIDMFKEGADIVLRCKDRNRKLDNEASGRMIVDEEGLYSVTNSKWGTAIANTMIQSVYKVGWIEKPATKGATSSNSKKNQITSAPIDSTSDGEGIDAAAMKEGKITAIDLTASVGGMTLGLAKSKFFDPIMAIEIDPHRANLCQQNMARHGMDSVVQVRTMDAMDAIPELPSRSCIVIDPPWGGMNYNKKQRNNCKSAAGGERGNNKKQKQHPMVFQMGNWTLEDILEKVSQHIKPCIVGLRLPVTFHVDSLFDRLRDERGLKFEQLFVRKLSVQLFVVIAFQEN